MSFKGGIKWNVPMYSVIYYSKQFVYWKEKGKVFKARSTKGVNGRKFPIHLKTKEQVNECFYSDTSNNLFQILKKAGVTPYQYITGKGKIKIKT